VGGVGGVGGVVNRGLGSRKIMGEDVIKEENERGKKKKKIYEM
jgi:hypothetical protein